MQDPLTPEIKIKVIFYLLYFYISEDSQNLNYLKMSLSLGLPFLMCFCKNYWYY